MANLAVTDANGDTKYLKASGAGTDPDPLVMERTVKQPTRGNLFCNATVQVAGADASNANPVPISDAGASLTVDQATRGNLNLNATVQVGGVDASNTNPVPVMDARAGQSSHQHTSSADMSAADADLTPAPAAGKRIVITDLIISAGATALALTLKEQTSGTVISVVRVAANSTVVVNLRGKLKLPTADRKLQGRTSAAGQVDVTVIYYSE